MGLLSGGQRQALTLLMATLQKPKLLLLDEHTAALDPKTAAKVLDITDRIVNRDHLTTLMITHNMKDAIAHGNRLIMMMNGKIILDIQGEEKKKLTVKQLLDKFEEASGEEFSNSRIEIHNLVFRNCSRLVYNLTAVLFCNQNFCRKHPLYKKSENDVTTLVSICLSVLFTVRFQLV